MSEPTAPSLLGFKERLEAAASAVIYPGARFRPIASHGGPMTAQDGVIMHVTTNHFDPYGYFSNLNNGASSTWWIGETVIGKCNCPQPQDIVLCEQYYDAVMKCWAQVAGNGLYQATETSGVNSTPLSAAQVHTFAHLYAWGHRTLNWALNTIESSGAHGFGWHGMGGTAWGNHPLCPGTLRKNQRAAILHQAQAILGTPTPAPPHPLPPPTHDVAPRYVGLLVEGSHGLPVHEWQVQMLHRGWAGIGTADGVFGPKMLAVVRQFETLLVKHGWHFVDAAHHSFGTTVDGKVGNCVWHAAWDAPNLT